MEDIQLRVMDDCQLRVMLGDKIACRHNRVHGQGAANLVTRGGCTNCFESKIPCPNPRPMPTIEQINQPITPRRIQKADCIHLGEETGSIICPSCCGGQGIKLKTFACPLYASCTIQVKVDGQHCCNGCSGYINRPATQR